MKTTYKGQDFSNCELLTLPNQAMSLQEIISRFIRAEPLAIGKDVSFFESEDDLEKLLRLDPVDKDAYIAKMRKVQSDYNTQEELRAQKREEKALQQAREDFLKKLEAEKMGANPPPAK